MHYGYYILSFILIISLITYIIITTKNKKNKQELYEKINSLREDKRYHYKSFNNYPKYYINLDRSEDRRKLLMTEIKEYNIDNIFRFPAIDGKKITSKKGQIDGIKYDCNAKCTDIELAITLSHLECIRRATERGIFPFVVLEDDIRFTLLPYWKKEFSQYIEEASPEMDIGLLTTAYRENKNGWEKIDKEAGAVAYIVTKNGAKNILNKYYKNGIWTFKKDLKDAVIDMGIWRSLETYYLSPHLFLLDSHELNSDRNNKSGAKYEYKDLKIISDYI